MGIQLSEVAAREVLGIIKQQQEIMAQQAGEGGGVATAVKPLYLRVGVKGGGCSGFQYSLDLTENMTEQDEQFNIHGVEVICDPKSFLYLNGVEIDFKDEVMGRGFVFKNPNATSSCGCGSSFSA
ncbi:MAG TPA: iron-sulfur cluster assembly accessory protein [Phycisphaerae bacterium]|jgi:iron-sulfur cluster assembly protein